MSMEGLSNQFMTDKYEYDAISQAIKLAKAKGVSNTELKPLLLRKTEYKDKCAENTQKLLRAMNLSSNIVHLEDCWFGVRYQNKSLDTCLSVNLLKPDEIHIIKRDARHERELRHTDLSTLLPAIINEPALDDYKSKLAVKATRVMQDVLGYCEEPEQEVAVAIETKQEPVVTSEKAKELIKVHASVHACVRWIQRVIGIASEQEAEVYRQRNADEVAKAVIEAYERAEEVWRDSDDIYYYFGEDNIMFVKGYHMSMPTIITLYEETFGFNKEINRMIALEQLKVLRSKHEELQTAESEAEKAIAESSRLIQTLDDEIAALESLIALKVSERASHNANRQVHNSRIKALKTEFTAEHNKLFKKWE